MADESKKIVRCCQCRGMMRISARALSVFCPHCQKRVNLETLRIVGSHPGRTLATCGDIHVESGARLNLEVRAERVFIRGFVRGSVTAESLAEVFGGAHVIGDIKAGKIVIHEGAKIEGRCEMVFRGRPPEVAAKGVPASDDEPQAAADPEQAEEQAEEADALPAFQPLPLPPPAT